MRALTTAETTLYANATGYASHVRVKVANSAGTMQDLATIAPKNMVEAVEWGERADDHVATASITVARAHAKYSLALLMEDSPLNLESAVYVPLLRPGRRVTIEIATTPLNRAAVSGDYVSVFDGYLDSVSWARETVELSCRDKGGLLLQAASIRQERVYGLFAGGGARLWEPSMTNVVGEKVIPSKHNGHYYNVSGITTGIAASTEPTWPTSAGSVTSGGVTYAWVAATTAVLTSGVWSACLQVEAIMQAIITDWVPGAPTLTTRAGWTDNTGAAGTPGTWSTGNTSPGWAIEPYKLAPGYVMDALKTLADQIGASIQYRWDSGSSTFKPTFYELNREGTTSLRTFTPSQYRDIDECSVDIAEIRNSITVTYYDALTRDSSKVRIQKTITATNAASVTKYGGTYWMGIAEGTSSQIDDEDEAIKLANIALSDLAEPTMSQRVTGPLFHNAEVGDLYTWAANDVHYTSDQKLAVVEVRHRVTQDSAETTFGCRGKPTTGHVRQHRKAIRPGVAPPSQTGGQQSPGTLVATAAMGGGFITSVPPIDFDHPHDLRGGWEDSELHISTSSATFTPSSSTLYGRGRQSRFDLTGLPAGTVHYARIIHRSRSGKISPPSPGVSFTPAYVTSADIEAALKDEFEAHFASDTAITAESVTGGYRAQIIPTTEAFDTRSAYNNSSGVWTAQSTGKFYFHGAVKILSSEGTGKHSYLYLRKNSTTVKKGAPFVEFTDENSNLCVAAEVTATLDLAATDTIELWLFSSAIINGKNAETLYTVFEGHRLLY